MSLRTYGLARATGLNEARVKMVCAAKTFTAVDRLAGTVTGALENVRHRDVAGARVTLMQDDEMAAAEPDGSGYTRIIGFRASISERGVSATVHI